MRPANVHAVSSARPLPGSVQPARAAVAALCGALGCGPVDTGVVELSWRFVDRAGDVIFPGGAFALGNRDSCDLPGRREGGQLAYDLRLQLEICDPSCAAGCADPSCHVVEPARFPCDTARASDVDVPASTEPYRFTVRGVIEAEAIDCTEPEPTCVAVPGPRDRTVQPGLVTDLQVMQIAVDIDLGAGDEEVLDLEACGCA
jgi:hypothetical protein